MKKNQLVVYAYKKCGTCVKALKFLDQHNIAYRVVPIRDEPPTSTELKEIAQLLFSESSDTPKADLKRLFNTSGKDYREGGWKDKLAEMTEAQIFTALSKNGNLIKRPLVKSEGSDPVALVGFKEEEWLAKLTNLVS